MVELRKRPAPKETATPAPAAKRATSKPRAPAAKATAKTTKGAGKVASEAKSTAEPAEAATATAATETSVSAKDKKSSGTAKKEASSAFPLSSSSVGSKIPLEPTFSKTITLHTSKETTLKQLLKESKRGIIIFSYPKASTPGCTTQACLFRDNYNIKEDDNDTDKVKSNLKAQGFSIFGLSADSVKSNSNFVTKQSLPYDLICDTEAVVSGPLGLKKPGGQNIKGTQRGVVLLTKVDGGDDEEAEVGVMFLGGPQKTLDACLEWLEKNRS